MPRPLSERLGPWLGSAVIHLVFIVVLAAAALKWRSDPPEEQLAIEGNIVRYEDLPRSVRSGRPLTEPEREPVPAPPPEVAKPEPEPEPRSEPEPAPAPTPPPPDAAAKQNQERQQQEAARLSAQREKEAALKRAAETKAAAAAEEKRKAEAALKQQEALAAQQRQQEKERAARDARLKAEREAELKRALASEEEGEAFARSGVTDEYRALLIQAIERNWIRPPSARAGLECTLYVTQAPGGTVIDVKIGQCNGDQAVRESVANAVYRSSPLPPPRDPRAFERRLVMVFKPTE